MALIKMCSLAILLTTALHCAVAEIMDIGNADYANELKTGREMGRDWKMMQQNDDDTKPKVDYADELETAGKMTSDWGGIEQNYDPTKPEANYGNELETAREMIRDWKVRGRVEQNDDYTKKYSLPVQGEEMSAAEYGNKGYKTGIDFSPAAEEVKMEIPNGLDLLPTNEGEIQQTGAQSFVTNFVAIGYNLLRGNPEGVGLERGALESIDPGLRLGRRIFKFTYHEAKKIYYNGQPTSVPDQVNLHEERTCSPAQKVTIYSGTSSYQKKLDANVDGEGTGGLLNFRYSLSAGYSEAGVRTSSQGEVIMDKMVICNAARAQYLLSRAFSCYFDYTISNDFYHAVKNLPVHYDVNIYKNFIDEWGTHFVVGVDVGGRQVERYNSTYGQLYSYASSQVNSSVSTGGSYMGYSGSLHVDVNTFNQHVTNKTIFGNKQGTVNSGSKIVRNSQGEYHIHDNNQRLPIPVHISLRPITTALDRRLWTQLPESGQTYDSLSIYSRRCNLGSALAQYATLSGAPTSSDPTVRIPNAWPDGTYALPEPGDGCPSGSNQFSWKNGWRYHDTENLNNKNSFSTPLTLAGTFGKNIKVEYCTKTNTSHDYGIQWPSGSYCIAKKGKCPSGFRVGNIYWDDEDIFNKNDKGGTLPDGKYSYNTRTYFCCRSDGSATNPIILPIDGPFYLYRQDPRNGCQRVKGMNYREEWVRWDDEDGFNRNSKSGAVPFDDGGKKNHKLHYCYYFP